MPITPINNANKNYTINSNQTPQKANNSLPIPTIATSNKDAKSAKNFAILAALCSLGTLGMSAFMLKKAHNLQKTTTPVIEKTKKIVSAVEKLAKATGIDKILRVVAEDTSAIYNQVSKTIKNITPILKKINAEEDHAELVKLNEQLIVKLTKAVTEAISKLDKTTTKDLKGWGNTFIALVADIISKNKLSISKQNINALKIEVAQVIKNSEISQTPIGKVATRSHNSLKNDK